MKHDLVPPSDLAAPSIKHLPMDQRIELWAQLVDESEALLIAGLKAKVGENGDWQEAYRQWYARRMEEHDRMQTSALQNDVAKVVKTFGVFARNADVLFHC